MRDGNTALKGRRTSVETLGGWNDERLLELESKITILGQGDGGFAFCPDVTFRFGLRFAPEEASSGWARVLAVAADAALMSRRGTLRDSGCCRCTAVGRVPAATRVTAVARVLGSTVATFVTIAFELGAGREDMIRSKTTCHVVIKKSKMIVEDGCDLEAEFFAIVLDSANNPVVVGW
jgi:hypothetical protein